MAYLPTREFNANEGAKSTLSAGPDAIERDIDKIIKMFNPALTHEGGTPGGIGANNIQEFTPNAFISVPTFDGTGNLADVLSHLAKVLVNLFDGAKWYETVDYYGVYSLSTLKYKVDNILMVPTDYIEEVNLGTWDADAGVYTSIRYLRRSHNTRYLQCDLSNKVDGNYLTDTWYFFDLTGNLEVKRITWTYTYTNGIITSKVPVEVAI